MSDFTRPCIFRYEVTACDADGKWRSACLHGQLSAAFHNLCQIGYSDIFPLTHLPYVIYARRVKYIENLPRTREAKWLQTKGKNINF